MTHVHGEGCHYSVCSSAVVHRCTGERELIRDIEAFGWRHAVANVDVETRTRGC